MKSPYRWCSLLSIGLLLVACVSCSGSNSSPGTQPGSSSDEVKLQGAGASFPAPLYMKWFEAYGEAHPQVQVDYQSIGSGAGVKSVIDKTVDFGASDAAMTPDEIGKVDVGVQLLPMTAGGIALAYNIEGVDSLKLSREAYAGIFLGKVLKWNDPLIVKTNPGVNLPDAKINPIVRADSSGTTFAVHDASGSNQQRVRRAVRARVNKIAELAGWNQVERDMKAFPPV